MFKPPAEVNIGCPKLKGDAAEKATPNEGNKEAAAATAAEFDIDRLLLVGKIDELPDPADDGLGESEGFPSDIEEDTGAEAADVGVDNVPLLLPDTELPPKLGEGDMLCPDLELGDKGRCWLITERLAIEDVRGLPPPLFGDEFLLLSDAVAAANIACCCFKACSVDANKLETEFEDSTEFNKLFGIAELQPDSFAAAKRDAKLGVLEIAPDTAF
jgi:hypothetical protein